jgi:hypothetical protein
VCVCVKERDIIRETFVTFDKFYDFLWFNNDFLSFFFSFFLMILPNLDLKKLCA